MVICIHSVQTKTWSASNLENQLYRVGQESFGIFSSPHVTSAWGRSTDALCSKKMNEDFLPKSMLLGSQTFDLDFSQPKSTLLNN